MDYSQNSELMRELEEELAQILGVSVDRLPGDVDPDTASLFLGNATSTLAIWRSSGRYDLRYYKAGRKVKYRVSDLIIYKSKRIFVHTNKTV